MASKMSTTSSSSSSQAPFGGPEAATKCQSSSAVVAQLDSRSVGTAAAVAAAIASDDDETQKKTFGKWIRYQLSSASPRGGGRHHHHHQPQQVVSVTDLYYDLRDGKVLLVLVEAVFGVECKAEKGDLRVHHLANVGAALKVIREKLGQANRHFNINAVEIVDGNPKMTLALVWAIILGCQGTSGSGLSASGSFEKDAKSGMEKALLNWCQNLTGPSIKVHDLATSFSDGEAFLAIIKRFRPDLISDDVVAFKTDPLSKLEFAFDKFEEIFGVPRLLDPEDLATASYPDKKSVMTYVMCIYGKLHHLADAQVASTSHHGGSVTSTTSIETEKDSALALQSYQSSNEDALEWLLEAEEKLQGQMKKIASILDEIKLQFRSNADYMTYLETVSQAVKKVLSSGCKLLKDSNLTGPQEKDVRIRNKLLMDRWDNLRKRALKRQAEIHERIMSVQRTEVQKLRDWMTEVEDRISNMGVLVLSSLELQQDRQSALERDILQHQVVVTSLSQFIYVPTVEVQEQSPFTCLSEEANVVDLPYDKKTDRAIKDVVNREEQELEDELMALGERWSVLCSWVENRAGEIERASDSLKRFGSLKSRLLLWMEVTETSLKTMEQESCADARRASFQLKRIKEIEAEKQQEQLIWEEYVSLAESLTKSIKADQDRPLTKSLTESIESVQDRWDVLTEILEAQKERLSRPQTLSGDAKVRPLEGTPGTKRKIVGVKRVEFETSYVKVAAALDSIEKLLEEIRPLSVEARKKRMMQVKAELGFSNDLVKDAIGLGEYLISEIRAESDFPPDYLRNVDEKLTSVRSRFQDAKSEVANLSADLKLQGISSVLDECKTWLESQMASSTAFCSRLQVEEALAECHQREVKFKSYGEVMNLLRDRSSVVKEDREQSSKTSVEDIENLCQKWNNVEDMFQKTINHLELLKKDHHHHADSVAIIIYFEEWSIMKAKLSSLGSLDDEESRSRLSALIGKAEQFEEDLSTLRSWVAELEKAVATGGARAVDESAVQMLAEFGDGTLEENPSLARISKLADTVMRSGRELLTDVNPDKLEFARDFEFVLKEMDERWKNAVQGAHNLLVVSNKRDRREMMVRNQIGDLVLFVEKLKAEDTDDDDLSHPIKEPSQLSQRTFKLLRLKEAIELKSPIFNEVVAHHQGDDDDDDDLAAKRQEAISAWNSVCQPILENYADMKSASDDFGEFKTLAAQENNWLENLEKKLLISSNSAADAEEISEELDNLENFLHNHSNDRLDRLKELAKSLSDKKILVFSIIGEAEKLSGRWETLSAQARERIAVLEGFITEAQEWEYKLIAVQDWLQDRDLVLSSYLEHELSSDDLPDDTEKMLREFEDHENLLAEMDEQVDVYRDMEKNEAASRLEEQLHLIHIKFQELVMKFELFQSQPAVEYEPRLSRVARQLRDIRDKLHMTEVTTISAEGIKNLLHHTFCIYNALSNVKAEVESVIKIGRRVVDSVDTEPSMKLHLTGKIDALKEEFNSTGKEVAETQSRLDRILNDVQRKCRLVAQIEDSLLLLTEGHNEERLEPSSIEDVLLKMCALRRNFQELDSIRSEFSLKEPKLLQMLANDISPVVSNWQKKWELMNESISGLKDDGDIPAGLKEKLHLASISNIFGDEVRILDEVEPLCQRSLSRLEALSQPPQVETMRPTNGLGDLKLDISALKQKYRELKSVLNPSPKALEAMSKMDGILSQWSNLFQESAASKRRSYGGDEEASDVEEAGDVSISRDEAEVEEIDTLPEDEETAEHVPNHEKLDDEDHDGHEDDDDDDFIVPTSLKNSPLTEEGPTKRQTPDRGPEPPPPSVSPNLEEVLGKTNSSTKLVSKESTLNSKLIAKVSNASNHRPTIPTKNVPQSDNQQRTHKSSIEYKFNKAGDGRQRVPTSTVSSASSTPEKVRVVVNVLPSPIKCSPLAEVKRLDLNISQSVVEKAVLPPSTSSTSSTTTASTPIAFPERICNDVSFQDSIIDSKTVVVVSKYPDPVEETSTSLEKADHDVDLEAIVSRDDESLQEQRPKVEKPKSSAVLTTNLSSAIKGGRFRLERDEVHKFFDEAEGLMEKISVAKSNLRDLEPRRERQDVALRKELIDIECRSLEVAVTTLLSRGKTLDMMAEAKGEQQEQSKRIKGVGKDLECAWLSYKAEAEAEKTVSISSRDLTNCYRTTLNELQYLLAQRSGAGGAQENGSLAEPEDSQRNRRMKSLFHDLEGLAERLRKDRSFAAYESSFEAVSHKWAEFEANMTNHCSSQGVDESEDLRSLRTAFSPPIRDGIHPGRNPRSEASSNKDKADKARKNSSSLSLTAELEDDLGGGGADSLPNSLPNKNKSSTTRSAAEICSRIAKLRNVIKAINSQLDTQVLSGQKRLENMQVQKSSLGTVKLAMDKVRSLVRSTEKDIECLSGGKTSVEYLEKLIGMNEKLQQEWRLVKAKFQERMDLWQSSANYMKSFESDRSRLLATFSENNNHNLGNSSSSYNSISVVENLKSSRSLSNGNNVVVLLQQQRLSLISYVLNAREIMSNLSTQESLSVHQEMDTVVQAWISHLRSTLMTSSSAAGHDHLLFTWLEVNYSQATEVVNFSDRRALLYQSAMLYLIEREIQELNNESDSAAHPVRMCQSYNGSSSSGNSSSTSSHGASSRCKAKVAIIAGVVIKAKEKVKVSIRQINEFYSLYAETVKALERSVTGVAPAPDVVSSCSEFQKMMAAMREEARDHLPLAEDVSAKMSEFEDCLSRVYGDNLQSSPSLQTSNTEAICEPSRTATYSSNSQQSSFHSEEALLDVPQEGPPQLGPLLADMEEYLTSKLEGSKGQEGGVVVSNGASIKESIRQLQVHLREVDAMKARIENHQSNVEQEDLRRRAASLSTRWSALKTQTLSRISELTVMLSDCEQFNRTKSEVENCLWKVENSHAYSMLLQRSTLGRRCIRLQQTAADQSSSVAELDSLISNRHRVKLFLELCQKMIKSYDEKGDDVFEVKAAMINVEGRNNNLANLVSMEKDKSASSGSLCRRNNFCTDLYLLHEWALCQTGSSSHQRLKTEDLKKQMSVREGDFNKIMAQAKQQGNEEMVEIHREIFQDLVNRWAELAANVLQSSEDEIIIANPTSKAASNLLEQLSQLEKDIDSWVKATKSSLDNNSMLPGGDTKDLRLQMRSLNDHEREAAEWAAKIDLLLLLVSNKNENENEQLSAAAKIRLLLDSFSKDLEKKSHQLDDHYMRMAIFETNLSNLSYRLDEASKKRLRDHKSDKNLVRQTMSKEEVDGFAQDLSNLLKEQQDLGTLSKDSLDILEKVKCAVVGLSEPQEQPPHVPAGGLSSASEAENSMGSMPEGWERRMQEDGLPYFINHQEETTQWDHPTFVRLLESVLEMNSIKFSVYRTAMKLRLVQKKLGLEHLDVVAAMFGFEEHGLGSREMQRPGATLDVSQMVAVLTSFYRTLQATASDEKLAAAGRNDDDVSLMVDLCLNWLLNLFDNARTGRVRVQSFKLGIILLCGGPLTEKCIHMFNLAVVTTNDDDEDDGNKGNKDNDNNRISAKQLGLLLFDCLQVPRLFGEIASFGGSNVEPSVRGCFSTSNVSKGDKDDDTSNDLKEQRLKASIDCKDFLQWLKKEPQCLVWLPVLHRLAAAENAKHSARCRVCGVHPILGGFRYHCLKCFSYDLCQNCFFTGRSTPPDPAGFNGTTTGKGRDLRGHRADHPMREYCTSTGTFANIKNFGLALKNSFRRNVYFKKKHQKLSYLPIQVEGGDRRRASNVPYDEFGGDHHEVTTLDIIPNALSPNLSIRSEGLFENRSPNQMLLTPSSESFCNNRPYNTLDRDHRIKAKDWTHRDEEHVLIASFCKTLHQSSAASKSPPPPTTTQEADTSTGNESAAISLDDESLEDTLLKELKVKQVSLAGEYDRLARMMTGLRASSTAKVPDPPPPDASTTEESPDQKRTDDPPKKSAALGDLESDLNLASEEAARLKLHTGRIEARIAILVDHNRQLEQRISRLRQLAAHPLPPAFIIHSKESSPSIGGPVSSSPGRTKVVGLNGGYGTLQSKVIRQRLACLEFSHDTEVEAGTVAGGGAVPDDGEGGLAAAESSSSNNDGNSCRSSSLNLSEHEVEDDGPNLRQTRRPPPWPPTTK